jgi:hypothetical protein
MIPRSTGYRFPGEMTAWFSAFRRQLPGGGYGAPADALGPVAIIDELRIQARAGEINRDDAASLERDIHQAFGELGPATLAAIGPTLDLFLKIVGPLRRRIGDSDDAALLEREATLLLRCLARGSVREAAFLDAWKSFRKVDRPPERCELRLFHLRELVEHAGLDWKRTSDRLDAVLEDRHEAVTPLADELPADSGETAGLPEERRLALCGELIGREPGREARVVWLVVDHSAIPEPWISVGPIDIYAGALWPDGLKAGGPLSRMDPNFIPPPELDDDCLQPMTDRIQLDQVLLARVSLSDVPPGAAARRAREVLESAIDFANAGSSWRLFGGEMVWGEIGGWSGSSLLSPTELARFEGPVDPVFEPTAEAFAELDPDWIRRLAAGDPIAAEAVRDTRLSLAAAGQDDPLLTLALGTRPIERAFRALDPEGGDRAAAARAYLRPAWVRRAIYGELQDAAVAGLEVTRTGPDLGELRRIESRVWRPDRPGRKLFSLAGFAQVAGDLLALVNDEGTVADRLLRQTIDLLDDPAVALRRIETLEARFERLLDRSERQRNTVIHGHLPPPALVEAGRSFLWTLGAYAVSDLFRHDTGEEPASLPLVGGRDAFERAKDALGRGARLVAALFPEETRG